MAQNLNDKLAPKQPAEKSDAEKARDAATQDAIARAGEDAKARDEKIEANREATARALRGEKAENATETVITDKTDVPDSEKTGTRAFSSSTVGADDSNPRVVSDTAAESSTLTRNQLDQPFGRGPSPQDFVGAAADNERIDREISTARNSTGDKGEVQYFYTDFSGLGFGAGLKGDTRVKFQGRVLATSDPVVIKYIEENFLDKGTQFRVKKIDEGEYRNHRTHGDVVPTRRTIEELDKRDIRVKPNARALTARAPRTDANPEVLEPEIGNAQQDHFTQADLIIGQERPGTSTGNIQLGRNKQELAAAAGESPAVDARADQRKPDATNAPTTGSTKAGMTDSLDVRAPTPKK
jgi:hypothetical protein